MPSDSHLEIDIKHNDKTEQPYKIESDDGYFTVYLGDPDTYVRGSHVYELEYEFANVITDFTDGGHSWQELYWDTNGNDWSVRFDKVTAYVHFENPEIAENFTGSAWCYVGSYGSSNQDRCNIEETNDGLVFEAEKLRSRENLTFDLEFNPDTFKPAPKTYDYRLVLFLIVDLAILGTLVALALRAKRILKPKRITMIAFS